MSHKKLLSVVAFGAVVAFGISSESFANDQDDCANGCWNQQAMCTYPDEGNYYTCVSSFASGLTSCLSNCTDPGKARTWLKSHRRRGK